MAPAETSTSPPSSSSSSLLCSNEMAGWRWGCCCCYHQQQQHRIIASRIAMSSLSITDRTCVRRAVEPPAQVVFFAGRGDDVGGWWELERMVVCDVATAQASISCIYTYYSPSAGGIVLVKRFQAYLRVSPYALDAAATERVFRLVCVYTGELRRCRVQLKDVCRGGALSDTSACLLSGAAFVVNRTRPETRCGARWKRNTSFRG